VWTWVKFTVCLWLIRKAVKAAGWLLLAAIAVAAWPVTLIAALGYAAAWLRGWPPARLGRAAAVTLPVTAVWLLVLASRTPGRAIALAPARAWETGWSHPVTADLARTFLLIAPAAIPAGLALAALAWTWRIYAITTGLAGITATAPITFDARQWKRQVRTARGLTAAPGAVPLLARGGRIPVGGTIRAIGHRWHPVFTIPATACARHMVIVGATGSGKTNLMIRLWAGWFTATLHAARAGHGHRPLLVVLDCKGGRDARLKADRTRRLLYGAGARRVAIWPDEARLSLWDLPPQDLAVLLYQMIDSGTGAAAYYADILQAALTLAITAPAGPRSAPRSSWTGSTPAGCKQRGTRPATRARRPGPRRRPGSCPTSSSATPPCSAASGRPWTALGTWLRPTPGIASWKAPANRRSPKRRPWRSPS
jgi:hypothetical protein